MRILLVEDDARLAHLVGETLARAQFQTDAFTTLAQGGYALSLQQYSGAILDRRLPDGDGAWDEAKPAVTATTQLVPYELATARPRRLTAEEREFLAGYTEDGRAA